MNQKTPTDSSAAWLEIPDRGSVPLDSQMTIGRSSGCSLVIDDDLISRKHARLQYDAEGDYWMLIDLGSTNGTYLNGERLTAPRLLADGDLIRMGDQSMLFHLPSTHHPHEPTQPVAADQTVLAIRAQPCWLLLLDVKQSTQLIQRLSTGEYSQRMRRWSQECESLIKAAGGTVNEYLGDGLLAFWRNPTQDVKEVARLLRVLYKMKSETGLEFRSILHHGEVSFGAGMSSSLEKLSGSELNFIFKLEKSEAAKSCALVLSEPAARLLRPHLPLQSLGGYHVDGFEGMYQLFGLCVRG